MPALSGPGVPENPRFREVAPPPGERRVGGNEGGSPAHGPVRRKWARLLLAPMVALGLASIIGQALTKSPPPPAAPVQRVSEPRGSGLVQQAVRLKDFRLFESGFHSPPWGQRRYRTTFDQRTTRFINWEITVTLEPAPESRYLPYTAVFYGPDNRVMARQRGQFPVYPGSDWARHSWGVGSRESGRWSPGVYRVEIAIGQSFTASCSFKVR